MKLQVIASAAFSDSRMDFNTGVRKKCGDDLTHQGMDSTRPLKMCCDMPYRDITGGSKSIQWVQGHFSQNHKCIPHIGTRGKLN